MAKALELEVRERIKAGESGDIEAVSASLQTSQAETELMSSEIDYESSLEDFARSLSLDPARDELIFPNPRSMDVPVNDLITKLPSLETSRRQNLSLLAARMDSELANVDSSLSRLETLPDLSFGVSYKNDHPSENSSQTLRDFSGTYDRGLTLNLNLNWILYNDAKKYSLNQSLLAKRRAEISAVQVDQSLAQSHKSLSKRIDIGGRRHTIARMSREIAEKKLSAEYERYQVGESDIKNLIDSQTALNTARVAEITARVELLNDVTELKLLAGQAPDEKGHSVEKGRRKK